MSGLFKKWCLGLFLLLEVGTAEPVREVIDGVNYHVLVVEPERVRVIWKDGAGRQINTFEEAGRYLEGRGKKVETLMNGGIYEPGRVPSGLLVQEGRELVPVNRRRGKGNFFLMPNGIFLIEEKGAAVVRTEEWPVKGATVRDAVQSGPLLLRNGKRHPAFNAASASRLHRNGVGVDGKGRVVFLMTDFDSEKFPNLFEFAEAFRKLGCDDALFLDGDLSQMRSGEEAIKPGDAFGSMIGVVAEE